MLNLENIHRWTTTMREPDRLQTSSMLTYVPNDEPERDCCLGLGCKVAGVGSEIIPGDEDTGRDSSYRTRRAYGSVGATSLPPAEFHLWLGTMDEEAAARVGSNGADVLPDWPEHLEDREGDSMLEVSCATLNDECHLTFPQIADVIDYFGLRETRP